MSRLSGGKAGVEVRESLGSDHMGSDCQGKESRLACEGLGSRQCGVGRDAFWKVPWAAESGPQERLEEEHCVPGHWTWGQSLGGAHSLVESRHIYIIYIDQLCPMLLVPLQKWEEGRGQYFSAERQELTAEH